MLSNTTTKPLNQNKMEEKEILLLQEFIEWAEENSQEDVFYIFENKEKAIEEFLTFKSE